MQLYKISFKTTNKCYIGITSRTADIRFKEHKNKFNKTVIAKAIRKHGVKNTMLTVLGDFDDWEFLCLAEQEAIEKYNSKAPNGYNITDGGEGVLGHEHTEESKNKMSIKHKERFINNPELREERSNRFKEYYSDPINRQANIDRNKIRASLPEEKEAAIARGKAVFASEESKDNARKRAISQFSTQEARDNASKKGKEYFENNPNGAKNISIKRAEFFKNNPDESKKISEHFKEYYSNDENRKKASDRQKARLSDPLNKIKQRLAYCLGWAKKAGREFSELPKDYFNAKKTA